MSIDGTLKADRLVVAQVTLDMTKSPVRLEVMAAMVDTDTGNTVAWIPCRGNLWSAETQVALREMLLAMEQDISRSVLRSTAVTPRGRTSAPTGIGEHIGDDTAVDAPTF
jgi:hypothetical protein